MFSKVDFSDTFCSIILESRLSQGRVKMSLGYLVPESTVLKNDGNIMSKYIRVRLKGLPAGQIWRKLSIV